VYICISWQCPGKIECSFYRDIDTSCHVSFIYLVSSVFSMLVSFNVTFYAKVSRDVKKFNIMPAVTSYWEEALSLLRTYSGIQESILSTASIYY